MNSRAERGRWWWGLPPDEELRAFVERLVAGCTDGLELIKEGGARAIWRAPDVSGGLLVKRFRGEGWGSLVLPSRPCREYRVMEAMVRQGVPVVRPLAFGERRRAGRVAEGWFLGRLVHGARTLSEEAQRQAPDDAALDRLVHAALDLLERLHDAPFFHRDMHAGNVLLDAQGTMLVTDLHSVWRVPRVTDSMRARNHAELLFSLRGVLDLGRVPVWVCAAAQRAGRPAEPEIRRVSAALERFGTDYLRGRVARCLRRSSEFDRGRFDGSASGVRGRVHHRRSLGPVAIDAALADHQRICDAGGAALLGDAARSQVTHVSGGLVVKSFRECGWAARLRQAVGGSRARVAWVTARRLALLDLPTPPALALVASRDGSAFLVTQLVPGRTLRAVLAEGPLPPAARAALAVRLGWLVGRLVREGIRHSDLASKNLLICDEVYGNHALRDRRHRPPDGPAVVVLDLDSCRSRRRVDDSALVRMLMQLGDVPGWVSRTDRRRFARAFRQAAGRDLSPELATRALELTAARRRRRELQVG